MTNAEFNLFLRDIIVGIIAGVGTAVAIAITALIIFVLVRRFQSRREERVFDAVYGATKVPFRLKSMTTAERHALIPKRGQVVYDTDRAQAVVWTGNSWEAVPKC